MKCQASCVIGESSQQSKVPNNCMSNITLLCFLFTCTRDTGSILNDWQVDKTGKAALLSKQLRKTD